MRRWVRTWCCVGREGLNGPDPQSTGLAVQLASPGRERLGASHLDVGVGAEVPVPLRMLRRAAQAGHDDELASCSTRMSGTLRSAPDLAPRIVTRTTGRPCRWTTPVSPASSIRSTSVRTQLLGLGT